MVRKNSGSTTNSLYFQWATKDWTHFTLVREETRAEDTRCGFPVLVSRTRASAVHRLYSWTRCTSQAPSLPRYCSKPLMHSIKLIQGDMARIIPYLMHAVFSLNSPSLWQEIRRIKVIKCPSNSAPQRGKNRNPKPPTWKKQQQRHTRKSKPINYKYI